MTSDPNSYLPLREPTFFILLSMSGQKKHGYAILKDVHDLSAGKVSLSNGTLYGALTRLQDQGLIERLADEQIPNSGRPRKAYQLTGLGGKVLEAEISRMDTLIQTARQALPKGAK